MPSALESLRVLDFTTLLPGPYATMCLADMGADILRVVSGSRPDVVDYFPPLISGLEISAASAFLGRNKRLMTLNLRDSRATEIVHRLISDYDIVIEQFRPGVMKKLGLDYGSLAKINPALIYCSITGYGQTGSMRDRAGHDINYIARSGLASYSGKKDSGPCLVGMQIADVASGSYNAVIGILAAFIYRNATGKGQCIDISMTDGMYAFNAMYGAGYLVDDKNPAFEEVLLNGGSLYDYYKTSDGRYISFGGIEPQFSRNFFNAINRPDLIQGGVTPKNVTEVKHEIQDVIMTRTRDEWVEIFKNTDACVEPVMTLSEAFSDALVKERELVVEVPSEGGRRIRQLANPIKYSETKHVYRSVGVSASTGGHTKEVLKDIGYTDVEIEEFGNTGLFS
jgi:alpha-methylacyl-CoA racemase